MREPIEQWERALRDKLQKELPAGVFQIKGPGKTQLWVSKATRIEMDVALQRELRKMNIQYTGKK